MQTPATIVGLKVICVLVPAIFILGSWAAFKFVWNITPEVREKIAKQKAETVMELPVENTEEEILTDSE